GVTRAQVRAMLAVEGGLLALLGAGAGLIAGGAISLVPVYVVNRQSLPPHVLPLEHGAPPALCAARRAGAHSRGARDRHGSRLGSRSDGHGPGARGAGRLVRRRHFLLSFPALLAPQRLRAAKVAY